LLRPFPPLVNSPPLSEGRKGGVVLLGPGGVVPDEPCTGLLEGSLTGARRIRAEVANDGAGFTVSNARVATPPDPKRTTPPFLPSDRGGEFTRGGKEARASSARRNKTRFGLGPRHRGQDQLFRFIRQKRALHANDTPKGPQHISPGQRPRCTTQSYSIR